MRRLGTSTSSEPVLGHRGLSVSIDEARIKKDHFQENGIPSQIQHYPRLAVDKEIAV